MIVEAANSPVTTIADAILSDRDIPIVPGILANAGGVTVSYFEWVQNIQALSWDETEVNEKLELIMSKAYGEVVALMKQKSVSMRTGAFIDRHRTGCRGRALTRRHLSLEKLAWLTLCS